jgi:hypothetical protein
VQPVCARWLALRGGRLLVGAHRVVPGRTANQPQPVEADDEGGAFVPGNTERRR